MDKVCFVSEVHMSAAGPKVAMLGHNPVQERNHDRRSTDQLAACLGDTLGS